jgi:hypothetical protein
MAACWVSSLVVRDAAAESGHVGRLGEEMNSINHPRSQGHARLYVFLRVIHRASSALRLLSSLAEDDGSFMSKESMLWYRRTAARAERRMYDEFPVH